LVEVIKKISIQNKSCEESEKEKNSKNFALKHSKEFLSNRSSDSVSIKLELKKSQRKPA
jgi:hypothetical protein